MSQNVGTIFYTVDADTSKLVDSSRDADAQLTKLEDRFSKTDKAANDSRFTMTKTAAAVKNLGKEGDQATSVLTKFSGVLAGLVTLRGISSLIQMADSYNEMAERVSMATRSQEEYETVQSRLLDTAGRTYRSMAEAQELYIRTAAGLRSMGYETEATLDITDSLSFAFVKNATSVDRANSSIDAFTKAINKGKVESDGWQTIIAAIPTIIDDIAEASGKSGAEIRAMGVSSQITARMLTEGLAGSLNSSREAADGMATTVRDAFTRLQTNLSAFVGEANRANGATQIISSGVLVLAENIDTVAKVLMTAGAGALALYISRIGAATIAQLKNIVVARQAASVELQLAQANVATTTAKLAQVQATVALGGASTALTAAQTAATTAAARLAAATTAMTAAGTSFLSILGGPIGIIALVASAAAGFVLFGNNASNAAVKIDGLADSIDKLGAAQLTLRRQQASEAIIKLEDAAREASNGVQALERDYAALQAQMEQGRGVDQAGLDNIQKTLNEQRAAQEKANEEVQRGYQIQKQITDEIDKRAKQPASSGGSTIVDADPEVAKRLQALRDEAEAAKLTGAARARLLAVQKLGVNATKEEIAEAEKLATQIYNATEGKKAGTKATTEAQKAEEENAKTIRDARQALLEAKLTGEELAVAKARASANKFATPEEVKTLEDLARALYTIQQNPPINANRQLLGQVDPIAGAKMGFEEEIANLKALNEAKLLEDQRYLELKSQAETAYDERNRALQEENFRRQSSWNNLLMNSLDRVGEAATDSLTGLIAGAKSGTDAIRELAGALIRDAIGSLVKMGLQYVKNLAMGQTAAAAATATGVATAAALSAAYATPAALASLMSFGGNAAPAQAGLASTIALSKGLSVVGGRQYGGPVAPGGAYRINENGRPEVFNANNGQQFMLPNRRGEVISNANASAGGRSSAPIINVQLIEDRSRAGQVTQDQDGDQTTIRAFVANIQDGGEADLILRETYGLNRQGR